MADLVFIVSPSSPQTYFYIKHAFGDGSRDVIVVFDRRAGERRRIQNSPPAERRHVERRRRDVTRELRSADWAVVSMATYSAG